eukprot:TRINITY_DN23835_c0_g1_i1.p1 TRINITY_DN23835_c0_g1~~TRINITY_DN23835_c0_g1_i1.p1  ORF type:complete len:146 (+),score=22.72 TRINITY_DN23835_c0_g1_i1:64-501(+)
MAFVALLALASILKAGSSLRRSSENSAIFSDNEAASLSAAWRNGSSADDKTDDNNAVSSLMNSQFAVLLLRFITSSSIAHGSQPLTGFEDKMYPKNARSTPRTVFSSSTSAPRFVAPKRRPHVARHRLHSLFWLCFWVAWCSLAH